MNSDVLKMGSCCVCGSRGRLSDVTVCLTCLARAGAVAESLREWLHFLRHGLEQERAQKATSSSEELRSSLSNLSRPLTDLCHLLEASSVREREGVNPLQEGWCW